MNNKLLGLCLTGSLVLPTGTAATAQQVEFEETPTGPVELQSVVVPEEAKPAAVVRDTWKATTEKQLEAIRKAAAAKKAAAAAKAAAAKKAAAEKAAAAKAARAALAKPAPAAKPAAKPAGGWRYPVRGNITSGFGPRPQPIPGVNPFHAGTDIAAPCGVAVVAAKDGRVIQAGWSGTYGNWILIQHANGVQTGYAHSSAIFVRVGQWVSAGQRIASVGMTGAATGCHVHFEVRTNAGPINPVTFLNVNG